MAQAEKEAEAAVDASARVTVNVEAHAQLAIEYRQLVRAVCQFRTQAVCAIALSATESAVVAVFAFVVAVQQAKKLTATKARQKSRAVAETGAVVVEMARQAASAPI